MRIEHIAMYVTDLEKAKDLVDCKMKLDTQEKIHSDYPTWWSC